MRALAYIPAQVAGCVLGAVVANGMFSLAAISISTHHRATPVAPADTAEGRVGERDDRVEVPAGHRAEHQDDRVEPCCRGGRVLEQLEANVVRESVCAAMPEPITSAARNAEPSSSASRRRVSGGVSESGISLTR